MEKAKQVMALGEQYARTGNQKLARKSLESAITYSQSRQDLNEDARVQYHNLIQQQAVVGLADRRKAVRASQNIQVEQPAATPRETDSLRIVSEKILRQQDAAAGVAQAIHVTIPEYGRRLNFHRALQVEPDAGMYVELRSVSRALPRHLLVIALTAALFFGFRMIMTARSRRP